MNVIIDYNVGNLANLRNALIHLNLQVEVVRTPEAVIQASRILLPGVGAFAPAMERFQETGLLPAVEHKKNSGTPLLGICVGAQLLMSRSEEDG